MGSYFEKGEDLTRTKNLVRIAVEQGLDAGTVESFLKGEDLIAEVKLEEQTNHQRGISGVPFYIINNKYGVSGAQPTEAFMQVFVEIGNEPLATAESCDVANKDC